MNVPNSPTPEDSDPARPLPQQAPDFFEQDYPDEIDNVVPTRGYQMTPMVGLGGSAGSIAALIEFFKAMPADSGMIFVVILHLSPAHESTLDSLLASATTMKVVQATNDQKVQPNHVYVIPPGKYLATINGHLKLTDLEPDRGRRVAVDIFFRSLADTHGPHSAAIVLSGADGDGALGIKRIKERGGLTIAQDPDQAEHPGMPRSAIETGMVDWVLDVSQIPDRLRTYFANENRLKLPPEEGPQPAAQKESAVPDNGEAALRDVLIFLRTRTQRDFSYYKRATILRRIARRMQVNGVDDLPSYLAFLRTHPGEAGALLQDLLISVTNFFRDRDVFLALEAMIPQLFEGKSQSDTVRVWCPACATGEEAYSMAIMLLEHARTLEAPPVLQVFACDLDDDAIQKARAGQYPDSIAADVSEDRLQKFFVKDAKGFRIRRELRETVLFAAHDLLKDAPFSRMDLISCRNLLIYLNRDAQRRAFDIFHFSLKPGGLLLLGSSEVVEDGNSLFRVVDKKYRIYAHQPAIRTGVPFPSATSSLARVLEAHEAARSTIVHAKHFAPESAVPLPSRLGAGLDRAMLADLHFRLIERFAPPSVIVNGEYEIMHLSEHVGEFLKFTGGEPTTNLLRVVDPALRIDLRTALFRVAEINAQVDAFDVPAEIGGNSCRVHIRVAPATEIAPGFLLITFAKRPIEAATAGSERSPSGAAEPIARHLDRELEQLKTNLRDTVEQYEASTEELKASNEELQAMNEELRSATEELETSREELQSINEELTTVNQEMKGKMEEIAHANSDLQNLMASTAIATVFLDRELAITRFTPTAAGLFHMISGDVGRPLAHLTHTLDYPDLIADAAQVLRTLVPIEREVSGGRGWYLARLQPYRTLEDHIAGVVLTLVDVTERIQALEALRQSEERMRILIESVKDYAIFAIDLDRNVAIWNSGAEALFGYQESEILGRSAETLFTPNDRKQGEAELEINTAQEKGRADSERWQVRKDGSVFFGSGSMMQLRDKEGGLRGFVKVMRDLTESKRTQESLAQHVDELTRFNAAAVGRESRMIELKNEINELCARLSEPGRYSSHLHDDKESNS